jgi:hypothetical protein
MTIQSFFTAGSAVSFPAFGAGVGGGSTAQILHQLGFDTGADMLIGNFGLGHDDNDLNIATPNLRVQYQKLWRDGSVIAVGSAFPQAGYKYSLTSPYFATTNDGRVARYIPSSLGNFFDFILLSGAAPEAYFQVNPLWPGDLLAPTRLAEVADILPSGHTGNSRKQMMAALRPATSDAFVAFDNLSSSVFHIFHMGSGISTTVVSVTQTAAWAHPRQIMVIDASTVCVVFRPSGALEPNETDPGWVRLWDTTSEPWTYLWEDRLPASDQVAAYDPIAGVLYSCGKRASNAIMRSSWLRRTPTSVASASIVGTATTLDEKIRTVLSTIVQDGQGSIISQVLVQWTLDAVTSGGTLLSNYSRTDNDGSATITYVGPTTTSGLVERVNVTAAEIDPS